MELCRAGIITVVFIAFLAMGTGLVSAANVNPINGHSYELVNEPGISWDAARIAASQNILEGTQCHGHLATVTSQNENDFLVAAYGNSLSYIWIGGFQGEGYSDTVNEGWQWVTGEPWVYTNWNIGEPNNEYYGTLGYEDALAYWNSAGVWNDVASAYPYGGYIVEYDCVHPVANAGSDQTRLVKELVFFDGSGSYDPDGSIVSYHWNFGDGTSGSGVTTSHMYSTANVYTVTLTVTDNDGLTGTDTAVITVLTSCAGINDLKSVVNGMTIKTTVKSGLTSKLDMAYTLCSNGQKASAIKVMNNFITQCNTQRGLALTNAQADTLITYAQRIIAALRVT